MRLKKGQKFSCLIIGSGTMPIRCAEILLQKGYELAGIVSSDAEIKKWAAEEHVQHFLPDANLSNQLSQPFDYLFSIVNEHILREDLLSLTRKMAINYHDAPLPKYAGTHATSWALMNREKMHGISWHLITDRVDAGDILKQKIVSVAEKDTAFSLNTKCYEAAINAFGELVDDLSRENVSPQRQNLDERTFFPRFKRPANGGIISWKKSAYEISALIRSLNFGNHPNPLGSAKIALGSDLFVVKGVEVLDSISPSSPGTINEIGNDFLKISTIGQEIILRDFSRIDGSNISIADLRSESGLQEGVRFIEIDSAISSRIDDLYKETCKSEGYWVNKLSTLEPAEPPYLNSATTSLIADYKSVSVPVPAGLAALANGRTADLLLTAFGALISRLNGTVEFDIGLHEAELSAEIAGLEKLFASQLPIRLKIGDSQNIVELLDIFEREMQSVRKHKTYMRDLTARFPQLKVDGILPVSIAFVDSTESFECATGEILVFVVSKYESACRWIYDQNRITPENIEHLTSNFTTLLKGIIRKPKQALSYQPILTRFEHHKLLVTWNNSFPDIQKSPSVHKLFEKHVLSSPDSVAIAYGDSRLTYHELNSRANQLANRLLSLGVGPESKVCVCVEPSLYIGEALLSVLKSGGVYVPLDPTYPHDRLAMLLEDIQPIIILTQEHLLQRLPATSADVLCLDRDRKTIEQLSSENPKIEIDPDQTAYIVYTSGTTGKPKGVMAGYGNLSHYIQEAQALYRFDSSIAMPAMARFTFSITFFELLNPLVAGGTLVILDRNHILDFELMAATLKDLTVIHASPSLFKRLLAYIEDNHIDPKEFNCLKHVSTGGDMVPPDLLETMKRVFRNAEIYVIYGCSEVSCMATSKFVSRMEQITKTLVGRPFPNVSISVVDDNGNPLAPGVTGEVCIGGSGVTKGYLNQVELTNKKFTLIDGKQFYKTGDRGRIDEDGNLEILGRTDFQIKLNGIRIEPVEIENSLRQLSGVREAVVAKRELSNGEPSIIGYLVLDKTSPTEISEIRGYLKTKLPDYMVPSAFVALDALPVNLNQKVDRFALPAPDQSLLMLPEIQTRPETELEKQITAVWNEVLGLDQISIQSDFFELGGQSLQATQVISRIREKFAVDLAISSLFEYPTIALLAEQIETLMESSEAELSLSAIPRISRNENLSLSFAQERLWFINQLDEKNIAYNIPDATELNGVLNIEALKKAINAIAERHEILRTVFSKVNGKPIQIIRPEIKVKLDKIDLRTMAAANRADEVRRLFLEEAHTPFDLQKLPLFRTKLIQTDEESYVFLTNFHHIVFDAWSMDCFANELSAFYAAFDADEKAVLPDLPLQYADFAEWRRKTLTGKRFEDSLSYWKKQLEGAPVRLELPIKGSRPLVQTVAGHAKTFAFESKSIAALDALARKSGTTRFMTLLAVYAALLYRYSNQNDIVVGSPIATRTGSQLEPLIGFFVNTLPLRLDLQDDPSFLELLNRVKQVSLDAYRHQDVPFEKIVEAVNPERSLSHSPLFQTMFVMQNEPMGNLSLAGISARHLQIERGVSMFDLTLWITDTRSGLIGEWEYNTDLFDFSIIERMAEHFDALLKNIAVNPELPLSDLSTLNNVERKKLLVDWNNKAAKYIENETIHQLFEAQTLRTPEETALIFQNERLTYLELNRRANRLAHYLRGIGVGPEVLVGICVERSAEMIVGILAILKAGGAYVPLDPAYPRERVKHILSSSRATVLLTKEKLISEFNNYQGNLVLLDSDGERINAQPNTNPANESKPNNLAYVIYTSGSTGKPKGVAIEHRNTAALLKWAKTVYTADQLKGVLASTSICFDVSVFEIFFPLSCGGSVILVENILHLPDSSAADEVTLISTVPSAMTELLRMKKSLPPSVGTVNLAGEPLNTSLVQQIYELGTVQKVYDLYGPSEDTTYSTFALRDNGPATIGRPISNTQAYILDRHLQLVPIGIPGELYLGGDGLARGYLNQPDLTAERFISNPFSSEPDSRIYKTGDLVRYLPDGKIEYIGRIDNQVKIRGFRIELGEIETTLLSNPEISEAVVIARENESGDKNLVAYIVAAGDVFDVEDLRNYLKQKLPNYMIPAAFVKLENLPLTPNGKIDRKALPAPTSSMLEAQGDYVAHRDDTELQLVKIWEKLLQVAPISIKDNFFELGGHSLLAIRMFAEIERSFGKSIPLATLFEASTIEKLADILRQDGWSAPESSIVPIQPNGNKPPFFCVHAKGGNVLFYRDLARHLGPDQPFYGIQARRLGGRQVGHATVEEMAEFYVKEMRTLQPEGPYYLGGSSFGGLAAWEIAQQLKRMGQEIGLLALFDTGTPDYPVKLTGTSAFQLKAYHTLARLHYHKSSLKAFNFSEKKQYILEKLSKAKLHYRRRIVNTYKKAVRKFYLKAKGQGSIPSNYIQIEDQIWKAGQNYVPKPYPGKATLFRATNQPPGIIPNPTLGWNTLAEQGLEIIDIPGHHGSIVVEPFVRVLAKKLSECIEETLKEKVPAQESLHKSSESMNLRSTVNV